MKYLILFTAMLKREFILMKRYLFNFLSALISIYILFLLLFFGARTLAGDAVGFGATLDGIVVGFLVWTFAVFAYSEFGQGMVREAQEGTLEQLYMSPVGFIWVCIFRMFAALSITWVLNIGLLLLMMLTTGRWLNLDLLSILALLLPTLAGVYGIGFMVGGLALVFKRIESFTGILQFALVGLVAAPIGRFPVLRYLPLAEGNRLIRRVMAEGLSFTELPTADLVFLFANSAFYLVLGLVVFSILISAAKNRGLLGHY